MTPSDTADEVRSYYGKPVLNRPTWKNPDVPAYLFSGGMAGASAVIAEFAAATGRPELSRVARLGAAGGALAGAGLLVHDLGRPARFLHMLRVFKVTSPLSVGSWILAPFSGLTALAAASELTGVAPGLGRAAGLAAAALGGPMTTYTAVLISNTAVPAWHEAHRELPVVFAASAVAAGGALAMAGTGADENAPAARLAVAGAAAELAASEIMERRLGPLGARYTTGRAGRWRKAARLLTATGALGALFGHRHRGVAVASGLAVLAGSLATRFAVFHAGLASAADPADTIAPQRRRLEERERLGAATAN
jgi:formate-dependent nitrite reductase membrane component NrfD